MSGSQRLMVKSMVVLVMATAALLVPRPGATLGACDTGNHCAENCESIPPNFATGCAICDAGVECVWAGTDPGEYFPCEQYVYSCAYLS